MFRFTELVFVVASWSLASAHTVIVYPGWRGNNIITNGTAGPKDPNIIPGSLGMNYDNQTGQYTFPYGMQWMYPCTFNPFSSQLSTTTMLTHEQVVACPHHKIAQNGPSEAALFPSSQDGFQAIQRHNSTSTWATKTSHKITRMQCCNRFPSQVHRTSNTRVPFAYHRSHYLPATNPKLATMPLSRLSSLRNMVRRCITYVTVAVVRVCVQRLICCIVRRHHVRGTRRCQPSQRHELL